MVVLYFMCLFRILVLCFVIILLLIFIEWVWVDVFFFCVEVLVVKFIKVIKVVVNYVRVVCDCVLCLFLFRFNNMGDVFLIKDWIFIIIIFECC